jgi:23S rRNA C2498 (ribose-2'-O)-methylase RlmM
MAQTEEIKTQYVKYVCSDPFHPNRLCRVITRADDIKSHQYLGLGNLDNKLTPIQRITFDNGLSMDVFDVGRYWTEEA